MALPLTALVLSMEPKPDANVSKSLHRRPKLTSREKANEEFMNA